MALFSFQVASQVSGGGLRSLPGATVTVNLSGTTTRAPIYDTAGNAISNPGIADSNGIFGFYTREGVYDIVATLGAFVLNQTIQVTLAPNMKKIADASYVATANDVGVSYTALTATRTLTLPPLSTMAYGRAFPIADESGNSSEAMPIAIVAASGDTINNGVSGLSVVVPFRPVAPVAGVNTWML